MPNKTQTEPTAPHEERAQLIEHTRALVTHHNASRLAYCVQVWFLCFVHHGEHDAHPAHVNDMSTYEDLHEFLCNLEKLDLYQVQK